MGGFPTIKWGDAANLEDYEGGRDYDSLKTFAKENLKPICSPSNIDLCDDAKKKVIKDAEENFEAELKKLQDTYQKLQDDKDAKVKEVKESGLGLMSAVLANKKKKAEAKEEL